MAGWIDALQADQSQQSRVFDESRCWPARDIPKSVQTKG